MNIDSLPIQMNRKRALWAYYHIEEKCNKESKSELKSLCRRLPILFKEHGIISTLCYLKQQKGKRDIEETSLYNWYIEIIIGLPFIQASDENECIIELINASHTHQRLVLKEILEHSIWLKNTTEAMESD